MEFFSELSQINFVNVKIPFASYRKKKSYAYGTLKIKNPINLENYVVKNIKDRKSYIYINKKQIRNSNKQAFNIVNKKKLSLDKDYFNDYISKKEVNSGSCSSDTINIWRKEEVLKVTLHECIHLLKYDQKNEDNFLKEHYRKRYNITSENMNIFEAYTEIWAELINIYLIVKLQT